MSRRRKGEGEGDVKGDRLRTAGFGRRSLKVGFDGFVLLVELGHVGDEVLDNEHCVVTEGREQGLRTSSAGFTSEVATLTTSTQYIRLRPERRPTHSFPSKNIKGY